MVLKRLFAIASLSLLAAPAAVAWAANTEQTLSLTGILVSHSGQSAMINRRIVQPGDRIGGAEVVHIDEKSVLLRSAGQEFVLRPGARTTRISQPERKTARATPGAAIQEIEVANTHRIQRGETLSGIAGRYADEDTDLNQVMLALFDANPQAFAGNINVMYAGATLRIPAADHRRRTDSESAAIIVAQHFDSWDRNRAGPRIFEPPASDDHYGPVKSGETLSVIASLRRPADVSLEQMMIAIFDANPKAFGGNIDLLYEGAILRVPDTFVSGFSKRDVDRLSSRRISQGLAGGQPPCNGCGVVHRHFPHAGLFETG